MLIPVSWLKDFVSIPISINKLSWKLTEIGITVEGIRKINNEEVLELEITPNRPDLMSVIGVSQEIAAVTGQKIKDLKITLPEKKELLPLNVDINFNLFSRSTGLIINKIKIAPSPDWLQKRLRLVGLRPINNVVDATNYVMIELGLPLHTFDYDLISGHEIRVELSKGGEQFTSVDGIKYTLPENAIIIKDREKLIDLAGIKGGANSGINPQTKTVYLHVTVDHPVLIRKASQALSLRSEASGLYERGVDPGSTVNSLKRAARLILDTAGGHLASDVIDLKKKEYLPWQLTLSLERLYRILGINIPKNEVLGILENLNLSPRLHKNSISVTIPTYRQDLKIEEDLVEEVARLYGYNRFPLSLPHGPPSPLLIPYQEDFTAENDVKNLLSAGSFTEIYSYSLLGKKDLLSGSKNSIKIANPISAEYEYLRPTLLPGLLMALGQNQANFTAVNLFELGNIYFKKNGSLKEQINLAGITNEMNYRQLKGVLELVLNRMINSQSEFKPLIKENNIYSGSESAEIIIGEKTAGIIGKVSLSCAEKYSLKKVVFAFELDFGIFSQDRKINKYFPLSVYPPLIEDLTFTLPEKVFVSNVIKTIKKEKFVSTVEIIDIFDRNFTFRINFRSPDKNLTGREIKPVRNKIISLIKKSFQAKLKS